MVAIIVSKAVNNIDSFVSYSSTTKMPNDAAINTMQHFLESYFNNLSHLLAVLPPFGNTRMPIL